MNNSDSSKTEIIDGQNVKKIHEKYSRLHTDPKVIFWAIFIALLIGAAIGSNDGGDSNSPECYQGPFGYECG